MKLRRTIFWSHLVTGVIAGIVIFLLSVTGTLLMYERQITELAEQQFHVQPRNGQSRLSADKLAGLAGVKVDGRLSLVFENDPTAPVVIRKGRSVQTLINPYTGELLGDGATATGDFFHWLTVFHRWFAITGDNRETAHSIVSAANLVFLFIVVSGIYLWLPKIWKWPFFRKNLLFIRRPASLKGRDYNWHHVFGFWALIPLLAMVITGAVISYPWAADIVYSAFGAERPTGPPGLTPSAPPATIQVEAADRISLDETLRIASQYDDDWTYMEMKPGSSTVTFVIDTGTGGEPTKRSDLIVNRADGSILKTTTFSDKPVATRLRSYIRYLHTGEALGFVGQTLFGLASLGGCLLVYTGLALAYRRLIQPELKRRFQFETS